MPRVPPFPSFLIIGGHRCGARWLRANLDKHPDICAPPLNTAFFADPERMSSLGLRWYREQFGGWRGEPILGEAAPAYTDWRNNPSTIARQIRRTLPDVRLIAILRNPLDRLESEVRHLMRWGRLPPEVDLYQMLSQSDPLMEKYQPARNSIIGPALGSYIERFGDDLHLMFYDDLVADPEAFYRSALDHIGAPPTFVPDDLGDVLFSDVPHVALTPLSDEERRIMFGFYRADTEEIAQWTGHDLSHWDPGLPTDDALRPTTERWQQVWDRIAPELEEELPEPPVDPDVAPPADPQADPEGAQPESTPSAVD